MLLMYTDYHHYTVQDAECVYTRVCISVPTPPTQVTEGQLGLTWAFTPLSQMSDYSPSGISFLLSHSSHQTKSSYSLSIHTDLPNPPPPPVETLLSPHLYI